MFSILFAVAFFIVLPAHAETIIAQQLTHDTEQGDVAFVQTLGSFASSTPFPAVLDFYIKKTTYAPPPPSIDFYLGWNCDYSVFGTLQSVTSSCSGYAPITPANIGTLSDPLPIFTTSVIGSPQGVPWSAQNVLIFVRNNEPNSLASTMGSVHAASYPGGYFCLQFYSCNPNASHVMDMYFVLRLAGPPAPSIATGTLQQFKSDETSTIPEGQTTTEDKVVFGAMLESTATSTLRLEVEYTTSTFMGTANATSSPVAPGSFATTTATGLQDGNYRWRARAVDASTTAVSTWQEFGMAGNTDFVVHQVPLYTQARSQFPIRSAQDEWADLAYGTGNYPDCSAKDGSGNPIPGTATISRCGCAITAAVMMLHYYGIATVGTSSANVNPTTLNQFLANPPLGVAGYDADGNLTNAWSSGIPEYAKDSFGNPRIAFIGKFNDDTPNLKSNYLDPSLLSVPTAQPVIVYERGAGTAPDHFLVVSAKLASTYSIRDPRWYKTKHLTQVVNDVNFERDYANAVSGVRLYQPLALGQLLPQDLLMSLASPAELFVTDPQGRRLGRDPISSTTYNEIAGASYVEEGISDPTATTTVSAVHRTKSIWIPNSISGTYNVQVIGTASGTYEFTSTGHNASGTSQTQVFNGSTQTNLVTPYNLDYTPSQSSTIAITSQIIFGGFLPPVNAEGLGIYKQGRTLPIKFQLTNASGTLLTDRIANLFIAKIQDSIVGTDEVALPTGGADMGNTFRFDTTSNQYIFNLDTTPLSSGTWQLKVVIDDGTNHVVMISIKP